MKPMYRPLLLSVVAALFFVSACQRAPATVDTEATVQAAIQATTTAQANFNASVDAAAQATLTAQALASAASVPTSAPSPSTAAPAAAATSSSPTLTPTPSVNYVAMSEQDLAALIDQSVQEAVAATTAATNATTTSTADSTLTTAEVQALTTSVTTAETEISQALALSQAYYDLYGQVATESLASLQAIESDLNSMSASMTSMASSLEQVNQTLADGLTLAESTITQLQATAAKATSAVQSAQAKDKTWMASVQTELDTRSKAALATKPTNAPTDWKGTVQSVNTYVDTVHGAVGDNVVTKTELTNVSQAGANAVAGLNALGGSSFAGLAGSIDKTTTQLAQGQTQQAKAGLASLDQSAKSLPSVQVPSAGGRPAGSRK
ncbi:MAG: hypothetical protein M1482_01710 [Chloroflexi bacterium]|nr:hypothetical protein [Chloroflexota bacterium]